MSYKKFTKDIGILVIAQLLSALSGIILLPIITKLLGAQNYGVWTQVLVTAGLITPIALLSLPYTLVRFLAGEKDKKEIQDGIWSVFVVIFVVSSIISLLLIFFANPVSKFLGTNKIFIWVLAGFILFECLNQLFGCVFRAFQQIKRYTIFSIGQNLGETGLVILAISLGYGIFGAILSLLVIRIIIFTIMGAIIIKEIGIRVPHFLRIKNYLYFSLPLIPTEASYWVIQSSDKYFIGFFLGTIFVGYYAPAYTLGCVLSFFMGPLGFLLPATLAKHHDANEIDTVKNYLKYSLKYFLIIAIPSVFGLSVLSKRLLTIFSTTEIAQHSYFVIPFIALSMLLFGVYNIFDQTIALKKKTHISGVVWIIASILNVGLNFIFVPRFGILGAAITTLLAYITIFALTWFYSFKSLVFEIDWKFISKSVLASVIMSLFVFKVNPLGLWQTLGVISVATILYFSLILLFKGLEKKEFDFLKDFLMGGD